MSRHPPSQAPIGRMSDLQCRAVTQELIRLCLGGKPERSELIPSRREIVEFFRDRKR